MGLVVMCCLCERVRDDVANDMGEERWLECKRYMAQYLPKVSDIRVSHGFCPECLQSYRIFLALPQEHRSASQKEGKA
jgi:hypothetical protein